jgi:hypothetical protein
MEEAVPPMQPWFPNLPRSDSEHSTGSGGDELKDRAPDVGGPSTLSLDKHIERNHRHLKTFLEDSKTRTLSLRPRAAFDSASASTNWRQNRSLLVAQNVSCWQNRMLIVSPTASSMKSKIMHPSGYRDLPGIESTSALAEVMGVKNWKQEVEALQRTIHWPLFIHSLKSFTSIPDSADREVVSSRFCSLLEILAFALGVDLRLGSGRSFGVGGLLTDKEYAIRGRTDSTYFVRDRMLPVCHAHGLTAQQQMDNSRYTENDDVLVMTCEFNTGNGFPYGRVWYHGNRGLRALAGLWSGWLLNPYAPVILIAPRQFKLLLIRNKHDMRCACPMDTWEGNGDTGLTVSVFPDGYHPGKTDYLPFVEMLVIILLASLPTERIRPEKRSTDGDTVRVGEKVEAAPDERHLATK